MGNGAGAARVVLMGVVVVVVLVVVMVMTMVNGGPENPDLFSSQCLSIFLLFLLANMRLNSSIEVIPVVPRGVKWFNLNLLRKPDIQHSLSVRKNISFLYFCNDPVFAPQHIFMT